MPINIDKLLSHASEAFKRMNARKLEEAQRPKKRGGNREIEGKRRKRENQTEREFNRTVLNGRGTFEAITLHLPGGSRYTPDYIVWEDGHCVAYEVKGSYRLPSEGRALTAFREARAAFPDISFRWFARSKLGGYREKHKA